MRRYVMILGAAFALLVSACGGGAATAEDLKEEMTKDGLITDEDADCIIDKLVEAGINPGDLTDGALGDNDPPPEVIGITTECLLGGSLTDDMEDMLDGPAEGEPNAYGDDPALDELWDGCEAGDMQACDDLYLDSPFGSEYEAYGNTCGNRSDGSEFCA